MWLPTKWTWSHATIAMWYVWNEKHNVYYLQRCVVCQDQVALSLGDRIGPHWYGGNLIIYPRFIISGALWFKVLSTVDYISGSGIMFSLCSIRWAILQIFKHCPYFDGQCSVSGSHWCLNHWLFPDHLESSINSDSGLMLGSSTIYMFVSYMRLLSLSVALKCEFTEVIWIIWKWLRMAQIWFCHSSVRYCYYIWDASMTRTNIGGHTDREMIFDYSVYDAHVMDVVCVHCRSSIVDHSQFVNHSWPFFFTIIIFLLINGPHIFFCYISQDNVFCACLSSLTRKPPFTRYGWETGVLNWDQN